MPDEYSLLSADNKSSASVAFNVCFLEEGKTILCLPMPDSLLRLIGLVAVYWGAFEVEMDRLITGLLATTKADEPSGWLRFSFVQRKQFLSDLVRDYVAPKRPEIASRYWKILGDAADNHWRRNVVLHGQLRVHFPPGGGDESPNYWSEGRHNGRDVRVEINEDTLDELWHSIAHLSGELIATGDLHGSRPGWPWTLPDSDLLQKHRDGNVHFVPIPKPTSHQP